MGGRNHCLACKGTGVVHRVGKTQECPVCEGKGIDGGTGLYCLECHGSGK
jgi:DnaJ-class molecular chaperone